MIKLFVCYYSLMKAGQIEMIKFLLEREAQVDLRNNDMYSPIFIATEVSLSCLRISGS